MQGIFLGFKRKFSLMSFLSYLFRIVFIMKPVCVSGSPWKILFSCVLVALFSHNNMWNFSYESGTYCFSIFSSCAGDKHICVEKESNIGRKEIINTG